MHGAIIVRVENYDKGEPQDRSRRIVAAIANMSDAELYAEATPRKRLGAGMKRDLHPLSVQLPAETLARLEKLRSRQFSVSALVDRILEREYP